ncbi:MAG: HAD-IC family P-type ATPase [Clostridia bacterium]|nr:HAD-IC family P-type ATPase [Clostridia bacterium]
MENFDVEQGIPTGLTSEEAELLKSKGKSNIATEKVGKSYLKIVSDNLFTFFNLIWAIITLVLIICQSYSNLTFLVVVSMNTVIAIIQEIKAKKAVEKLSVTTDPMATVLRDGEFRRIKSTDIVIGDIMLVELGKQVLSDAVVVSGIAEVNESMLTGEADAIKKQTGDRILAGSFLVSGRVYAKVINVGKDNYMHKLEKAAKSFNAPASNLFRDLNRLIKSIAAIMLPLATLLLFVNYVVCEGQVVVATTKTCGFVVATIPAGVYLLVTMTLTLSVVSLSKKRTLVQDMYSIEMLASADVICLDKTGTITDGTMQVETFEILDSTTSEELYRIVSAIEGCDSSVNSTSRALSDFFGKDVSEKNVISTIPFSSTRKYSAFDIEDIGAYSIGAPHFVPCPVTEKMEEIIASHAKLGHRVILLSRHTALDTEGEAVALIAISDRIRPAAKETIEKFQAQGVAVKVISGDHAETVSTIAKSVGIIGAENYLSCENISDMELIEAAEKYAVFGRVTPEQKVLLIKTLKANGHTVAMTGDGVNDTLALKESNCAIAMADGSEVARKISQIVLLDSDFASLPDVVKEGRRCINNVRRSSSLFLMKTIFAIFVGLVAVVTISGYPFDPKNLFLLELIVIGLASVMLALEPNHKRIEGSYIETVLIKSVPNAIAMFLPVLALMIVEKVSSVSYECRNSISIWSVTAVGILNLIMLCRPFTKWRALVVSIVSACLAVVLPVSIFLFGDTYDLLPAFESPEVFSIVILSCGVITVVLQIFRGKIEKFIEKRMKSKAVTQFLNMDPLKNISTITNNITQNISQNINSITKNNKKKK